MSADEVALHHSAARRRLIDAAARVALGMWGEVDPERIAATWAARIPEMVTVLTAAQRGAASAADTYLNDVLTAQRLSPTTSGLVVPAAFAGVASDGRALNTLLVNPSITTLLGIKGGATTERAMAAGRASLDMLVRTQVADAGRAADRVAMTARRTATGYVRVAVGKSCARCLVLAGRVYRWSAGFDRHPRCDCIHLPTQIARAGSLTQDPDEAYGRMSAAERTRAGFSAADQRAIAEGADLNQVVNARRGMYVTTVGSQSVQATKVGAGRTIRLTTDEIFRIAGDDRDEAIRLLRRHGYLLDRGIS